MDPPAPDRNALQRTLLGVMAEELGLTNNRVSPTLDRGRNTTHVQRDVPTTIASTPDPIPDANETNEGALPVRNDDNDNDTNDSGTTRSLQQHQLVGQDSGLPPTPPTMVGSDIAESQPERGASPDVLFADRVRNALQSHKSGRSTPDKNLGNHSPPTPDASPRRKQNLAASRPTLKHYSSSHAESFKTAAEGLSANGSTSRVHSPAQTFTSEQHKTWFERAKPVRHAETGLGLGLQMEDTSEPLEYESGQSVVRRSILDYTPESQRRNREPPEPFPAFDSKLAEGLEAADDTRADASIGELTDTRDTLDVFLDSPASVRQKNYSHTRPETSGDSDWLDSINPNLIAAALRPEPSPVSSPATDRWLSSFKAGPPPAPSPDRLSSPNWPSFLQIDLESAGTFSDNAESPNEKSLGWDPEPLKSTPAFQRFAASLRRRAASREEKEERTRKEDEERTRKENEERTPAYLAGEKRSEERMEAYHKGREDAKKVHEDRMEASPADNEVSQQDSVQPEPIERPSLGERLCADALRQIAAKINQVAAREVEENNRLFEAKVNQVAAGWDHAEGQSLRKQFGFSNSDLTEDSERGEVRVKNYQMESDSDRDRTRPSSSDGPPSPSWRKPLQNRAALHKLRAPIRPGDDIKRPDEALLYTSSTPWKRAKAEEAKPQPRQPSPPRREMDSEVLRTGNVHPTQRPITREDLTSLQLQEVINYDLETPANERGTDVPDPEDRPQRLRVSIPTDCAINPWPPTSADISGPAARRLREFTPSVPPAEVESPPNTAAKESLVSNNRVYKAIQEENAKRHSAVSDGSAVQALLVFPTEEQKRTLRHTPKRESLRADVSTASLSKPDGQEGIHTPMLRHKRGMDSIGSNEAIGAPTPEHLDRRIRTEPIKLPSAKLPASTIRDNTDNPMPPKTIAAMPSNVKGGIMKPPKLRRSLRDQTLDRRSVSFDLSAQQGAAAEASPSPRLRKFSRKEQLDQNFEVRRTSLGPESQLISHHMDLKLDRLADDLTNAGREMQDRTSINDRRTSSETRNPRLLHQINTPLSTSLSERTGVTEAEVGLARGVEIHQYNNDNLLLIHERPLSYDQDNPLSDQPLPSIEQDYDAQAGAQQPEFRAFVETPEIRSEDIIGLSTQHVDSPLINPRVAPAPPAIHSSLPTPSEEKPEPQRGLSWSEKAKRILPFSEHWQGRRQRKEERAAEKRREALRGQIGTRVFHAGGGAAPPS